MQVVNVWGLGTLDPFSPELQDAGDRGGFRGLGTGGCRVLRGKGKGEIKAAGWF